MFVSRLSIGPRKISVLNGSNSCLINSNRLPVMFVGDSRFDEKVFEELRRVARNSLFVKKPVTAEVFVQQVELLAPQVAVPAEGQEGIANLFGAAEDETAASTLKQLIRLRSRLEVKNALKVAQMAYLDELIELSRAVLIGSVRACMQWNR